MRVTPIPDADATSSGTRPPRRRSGPSSLTWSTASRPQMRPSVPPPRQPGLDRVGVEADVPDREGGSPSRCAGCRAHPGQAAHGPTPRPRMARPTAARRCRTTTARSTLRVRRGTPTTPDTGVAELGLDEAARRSRDRSGDRPSAAPRRTGALHRGRRRRYVVVVADDLDALGHVLLQAAHDLGGVRGVADSSTCHSSCSRRSGRRRCRRQSRQSVSALPARSWRGFVDSVAFERSAARFRHHRLAGR